MRFTTVECWRGQKVDPKPTGATRIVFVGDSTTLGAGSQRSMMDFNYDYHFQMDGSKAGFKGFPFQLYQMLKESNKTEYYQIINLASDNFTLWAAEGQPAYYKDTCEYMQLMSSEPDVVISMLGAKESLNKKAFTPEAYVQAYTNFLKEMEGLPSKPLLFILEPVYGAKRLLAKKKAFKLNQLDGQNFDTEHLKNWEHNSSDIRLLNYQVAEKMKLPYL